jgi:hypothetical protein
MTDSLVRWLEPDTQEDEYVHPGRLFREVNSRELVNYVAHTHRKIYSAHLDSRTR